MSSPLQTLQVPGGQAQRGREPLRGGARPARRLQNCRTPTIIFYVKSRLNIFLKDQFLAELFRQTEINCRSATICGYTGLSARTESKLAVMLRAQLDQLTRSSNSAAAAALQQL